MSSIRPSQLDSSPEIESIAHGLLKGSKTLGKFPTQVDNIASFSELAISRDVDLGAIHESFLERGYNILRGISKKLLGMVDIRERIIYLNQEQPEARKAFVKLHEVGHFVLPWQRETFLYVDDKQSLDPEVKEVFEQEASYLASCVLFQGKLFDEEAAKLELTIRAPMHLATMFGGSHQAAIRKYVLSSPKRCAVLVFSAPLAQRIPLALPLRNCFESSAFLAEFGQIITQDIYGIEHPFVLDLSRKRRLHTDGKISLPTSASGLQRFQYHFYFNFYNTFVFLLPEGETNRLGRTISVK